ncbi:FAD-dependent oxidoreductase family protein [Zostera marina]|uniref:FAD-dependent oxidoreductase domain-containing protein 1 n=1 Tax=Zostera marina TaxID=29655 RepID=A0A0K9PLJ1_ZOSMR|nr:FAD-dependent oxidoreductase family protein [Zostera marina]
MPIVSGAGGSKPSLNGNLRNFESCYAKLQSTKTPTLRLFRRGLGTFRRRCRIFAVQRSEHDVVVVGAGIIGQTIARKFLLESDLSVALVDAHFPCSRPSATGAGQGYIWMANKTPRNDLWELSKRSKQLWENLTEGIKTEGLDPSHVLGWKKTGSLLIGRTSEELTMLEKRVEILSNAGLRGELLSSTALRSMEPEVDVGEYGGAAYFPDDCQMDAMRTISFIEKGNRSFSSEGRYAEFYNNPAVSLIRSSTSREVEGIQTSENLLYARRAVVIAAGAWSNSLMKSLVNLEGVPDIPVQPRKGHLLVVENSDIIQIHNAMMEIGYVNYSTSGTVGSSSQFDSNVLSNVGVSMVATTDTMGNLIFGSSREFCGFNADTDDSIIKKIWERSCEYFPCLRKYSLELLKTKIRVGLRPWIPDGKPIIARVPGLPKLIVATGHEGAGLIMSMGTAELVGDMVLGNTIKINCAPFSFNGTDADWAFSDDRLWDLLP